MTTSLFWHLLTNPDQWAAVATDPSLAANAVEESLRLEPAAGRVDRYATSDGDLGGAQIHGGRSRDRVADRREPRSGDLPDPDAFDISRSNARSHLAFAQGPHACVGLHLARLETRSAPLAVLDAWPGLAIEPDFDATHGRHFQEAALTAGALDARLPDARQSSSV